MVDKSPFIIKECLIVRVWDLEKRWSGQKYNEIRVNFALHFNKAAPTEANYANQTKKHT
jgi:hypothetical protein